MNELQRMQYLDAMGVDTFVPRFVLSKAKLSTQCELPVASEILAPSADSPTTGLMSELVQEIASSAQPAISVASIIGDAAQSDQKKTETVSSDIVPEIAANENDVIDETVEFLLSIWSVDSLLIIDSVQKGQALPTASLLTNILIAIGKLTNRLPAAETFQWPLPNIPNHNAGWSDAYDWVSTYLESKVEDSSKTLFLCGHDAYTAVSGSRDYEEVLYQYIPLAELDVSAYVLPSLSEILYQPQLKKSVWLAIKPR